MSLRGKAAIVGFAELPTRRVYPGRSTVSLLAEAAKIAIADAGLRREQMDGVITPATEADVIQFAEHMGLTPAFCNGAVQGGAGGAFAVAIAAAAIEGGLANTVVCAFGSAGGEAHSRPEEDACNEWEAPFGPVIAANGGYGLLKQRHMHEFGTTQEQFAKIAVDERFNSLNNPNGVWQGKMITIEEVLNSRFTNDPLHLLECVMPCAGAGAVVVTSAELAKMGPHPPAYLLGAGGYGTPRRAIWQDPRMTTTPVTVSARRAYEMARYSVEDVQFAEFYDPYTIAVAVCIEDAGVCPKGEIGPFYEGTDTTYNGNLPINTDGGQLGAGQTGGGGGGFRHVIEATRQLMGRAGERQVTRKDLCLVNGSGGPAGSVMCTLVLGTEQAL